MIIELEPAYKPELLRGDFADVYGNECSIEETNNIMGHNIKLGRNDQARITLSRETVAALLPHLQRFAETGTLKETAGKEH